ncbi:MAG: hypothetical protein ACREPZ_08755 [Rhodanobacteraceae bacterium]
MLKELTKLFNGLLFLHGHMAGVPTASIRTGEEAPATQMPEHDPRTVLHHRDRHPVEWLLLSVIWSGTLLLLSRTALGLAGMA